MEKKYYSEEIEKNTRYREEYLSGLNAFLQREKGAAEERRRAFANPENYKNAWLSVDGKSRNAHPFGTDFRGARREGKYLPYAIFVLGLRKDVRLVF